MTAEARDVMLWVARWGPSVHRPDTVARYDDLLHRFVTASLRPPAPERPARQSYPYVDLDELPLDDPGAPVGRGRRGRWLRPGARSPLR
jgi:hypothetical protein